MAADIQKPAFPQQSIVQNRPKLQAGTQVEVRSVEEGFQGSWHSGMVAGCENHIRVVEYHNLLGDSSEKLVESVEVTPMVDGNIPPNWRSSTNYRGLIRPLPPRVDIDKWGLPFGLCVDVFHNDAWWEGVIFDHNDGSEERLVFFPDIGDDLRAHFEMLRVTQDWDEATEDWTCRGNWVFLELIEEVEREWPLLVSVKQIWYELRIKKGSENLKEWTCQTKSIWKELVLGVVSDNFKLTLKEFFHKLNSSGLLEQEGLPLLELTEVALDSIIKPACDSLGCVPFGPSETSVEKVEEVLHRDDLGPPGFSKVLSDNLLSIGSNKKPEGVPSTTHRFGKLTQSTCREKIEWLPAGTDIVPGPEFCPYMIIAYIRHYKCGLDKFDLIKKVRQHLSYMGWKIEYTLYRKDQNKDTTRFRYTSPDGMIYYSLNTICGELSEAFSSEMIPSDDQRNLVSEKMLACKKTYRDSSPSEAHVMGPEYCPQDVKGVSHLHSDADALLSVHSNDKLCKDWYVCSSGINPELSLDAAPTDGPVSPTFTGKLQRCKMRKLERSQSDRPIVEPEYSLKAVEDYYRLHESKGKTDFRKLKRDVAVKKLQRKVKKHLAFVKWSIFYTYRGEKERKVIKYRSPSGLSSYTLLGACKICLKEAGIDDAYAYARRLRPNVVSRENEGYGPLAIERQCPPVAESSGTSLSRELTEMGKAKVVGVRKLRFKRKNGVFSLDANWLQREKPSSSPPQDNQGNELVTGSSSSGRVLRSSKRAREVANLTSLHQAPRTVLSWLIEKNVVLPRAKILYRSQTDGSTVAEGRVTRDGIKCNCCQSCFSLSNFEAHAGSTGRHPSANIFLEDGRSLLDCQNQLKRDISIKRSKSEPRGPHRLKVNRDHSKNDYICSVCHFGGELILCDQCPSSFHTYCLGLKEVPDGDWFCPSCCCGICDQSRFDRSTEHFTYRSGVHCEQCQRQYHVGCLKEKRHAKLESSPKGKWFCNTRCEEIYLGLHRLLGKPVPMGMNNLTWTLLKYTMSDSSDHNAPDTEELETCYPEELETYSKLNVALSVMHECFEPVKEPSTRRDLVEDVIFCRTSELNRLNFQGFYTVLLERNDELISVATVRIYGDKVAEVPLVATRFQYRRLGMCRVLMNELEKKLMELGVERLVLPAVPSVLHTWTTSFGFSVMTKLERLKFLDFTFLNFQGTFMCQKLLKGPSQESSMLRGTQLKLCDSANGTDVVDLDGSSAVSEVLQAERIEESAILDQGSSDMARGGGNEGVIGASPLDVMVDQSTRTECQSEISMDCLFEAHNKEGENNGNNSIFKCYKRRKLAAACGS